MKNRCYDQSIDAKMEEALASAVKATIPVMEDNAQILCGEDAKENDGLMNEMANGWTRGNELTVRRWQRDIEKASFVYGEILDALQSYASRIQVCSLIGSALIVIMGALSVTLGAIPQTDSVRWAIFSFNIVSGVVGGIMVVLNTIPRIKSWDTQIKQLTHFTEKLTTNWLALEAEMTVTSRERVNASDFIKRNEGVYLFLMQQCPAIDADDYVSASHRYQERLAANVIWTQRFRSSVASSDIQINVA